MATLQAGGKKWNRLRRSDRMIQEIDPEKCTGCGLGVELCPLDTLGIHPFQAEAPPCQEACPAGVDAMGVLSYLKRWGLILRPRLASERT